MVALGQMSPEDYGTSIDDAWAWYSNNYKKRRLAKTASFLFLAFFQEKGRKE